MMFSSIDRKSQLDGEKFTSTRNSSLLSDSSDDFDEYDIDDFEIKQVVDSIFKGKASRRQICQLSNSLSSILDRAIDDATNNFTYCETPNQYSAINIIIPISQPNPVFQQPRYYLQAPPQTMIPLSNPYQPNTTFLPNQLATNSLPQVNPYLPNTFSLPNSTKHSNDEKSDKKKKKKDKKKEKKKKEAKKKKIAEKLKKEIEKKKAKGKTFDFSGQNSFSGIFNYLRSQTFGDRIENFVSITSSSQSSSNLNNLTKYDNTSYYFKSKDTPNNWVCFDFRTRHVIPSGYTIRSIRGNPEHFYPKNWVIEGSNDKNSWEILDEQKDCPHLNGNNVSHTFIIKNEKADDFQYIRIRQTGTNWNGSNHLGMNSFELFGTLLN